MWDASCRTWFLWKGWLINKLGDMLGSAKANGCTGHQGKCGCHFCNIIGQLLEQHYYFPCISIPLDDGSLPNYRPAIYDPLNLPMRTTTEYTQTAKDLALATSRKMRAETARDRGVISITPVSGLRTFRDPWTFFAGDLAHLHWKNDAELIFDSTMGINKQESLPEPWHPTQEVREEFGNMVERSKVDIPYDFSQATPRNTYRFRNTQYKMHEWWDVHDWLLIPC
ncbi:hypothetical protein BT69DRAFT_274512, partial [Atractiella rhizophila]